MFLTGFLSGFLRFYLIKFKYPGMSQYRVRDIPDIFLSLHGNRNARLFFENVLYISSVNSRDGVFTYFGSSLRILRKLRY